MEENEVPQVKSTASGSRKLLLFVMIAEVGFVVFTVGYAIALNGIFLIPALPAVASVIFTALYTAKIKPRAFATVAMICAALSVFSFLLIGGIANLLSIPTFREFLEAATDEWEKADMANAIRQYAISGSIYLAFAVLILPLSVYLPMWYLRKTANGDERAAE